ncbi:methyltransferase [Legionella fallonii]|uniref:Putative O-demethylpuromycin-O-methyltransferase n=1 Tax=Legionella fallonii LLAP-10 TaxID=1212491 RepID=A0A098G4K0_9GAMM|nr:methyltransferase [Legionella fallonii]CEG56405.1 putative O-demethylpuromycin-O-methyltransferase [Legionella fallonii LLAP-10]
MNKEPIQPHIQLAIMSRDYVISRAIHAIAHLGIADYMSDRPIDVHELAHLTSTVPELLDRILTFLSAYGLFIKEGNSYALTSLSAPLRQDHPNSMQDILSMVDESWWQAFAQLETTLKTGETAFKVQHGLEFFDFLNQNPEKKIRFQKGISKLSALDDKAITQGYNFDQFKTLTDIGAGHKELSQAIKEQCPSISIHLFNLVEHINKYPSDDYWLSLPKTESYLFKGILHDFDDEKIVRVLIDCYQHMSQHSSLIIAEQVIPEHDLPHTNKTMDIVMMVLLGGRQRKLDDWRELIESTGFKLKNTYPTKGIYTVMEFLKDYT